MKKFAGIKIMTTFASANEKQRFLNITSTSNLELLFEGRFEKLKKSLQKVLEKFGGLKKLHYLCTTFRSEKVSRIFQMVL